MIAIISKYKSEAVEYVKEKKLNDVVYVMLPQDLKGLKVDEAVVLTPPWYGFDKDEVLAQIVEKTPPPKKKPVAKKPVSKVKSKENK